ncbi:MAG: GNAT family N-acetyltransferase, partial [Bacteroidota bacterium]|nr:GNAT family N-acetyltransferase [Bacteroidota bacterium]
MFPNIYTERLVLRQILQDDIEQVFKGLSDERVVRYYGVFYDTLAATQAQINWYYALFAQQTGIWWGLCTANNPELIGACGINNISRQHGKAELGFWLMPAYWNQGYMYEAVDACLDFVFNELRLHRLEAYVETLNHASAALLQKLRFQHEGTLRDYEYKNGKYITIAIYSRLCTE